MITVIPPVIQNDRDLSRDLGRWRLNKRFYYGWLGPHCRLLRKKKISLDTNNSDKDPDDSDRPGCAVLILF
jgi:hypothetical protein